uniref:NADH dehydrogenase [ubiquinone] 1 beta subcomplex subunit 11, mitochondrial n=1 Tax=Plectus sambesii TaxID=2011161 RepID=A0A914VQ40_9BILA
MLLPSATSRILLLRRTLGALPTSGVRPRNSPLVYLSASASSSSHHGDEHHSHGHGHGHEDTAVERQSAEYRPGTDSYAYENPWPKLNKGRLDWLFGDGWRRPLAADEGGKMRREWISFGQNSYDEYKDWARWHWLSLIFITGVTMWFTWVIVFMKPDWPDSREWAIREAHFELARREAAGLPLISKDLIRPDKMEAQLPSDAELGDFQVVI